ncbi:MAG TPA: DUF1080 domain-containing protein [Phycisphaerae bacterium]|nr:DUF1080 domain-containing protein [Phycisphaerae bacterium]
MHLLPTLHRIPKTPLLLATLILLSACTQTPKPPAIPAEAGYVSLFNGKDLTGWGYANGAKFDGLTEVPGDDRRFNVVNGLLTDHARTPQQRTHVLQTTATFAGDFVLKLEFRASPRADSGIFVRGRQLQCRDYSTVGPYTTLKKYKPQEWNQIEVIVKGATALCTCNGEVLEAAMPVPPNGGIGLESDGGTMEYRNIRLKLTQ